ncbi:MAG: hypothetical protein DMG31_18420, partial [Acidobacteria bacterium]
MQVAKLQAEPFGKVRGYPPPARTLDTLAPRAYLRRKEAPSDRQLGGRSMAISPAYDPGSSRFGHLSGVENGTVCPDRRRIIHKLSLLTAVLLLLFLAPRAVGQNSPKITSVAPATGKVNDSVTLTGENLDKDTVSAVFLSDD